MFLEISQNSRENTCTRVSFLIKLQAYRSTTLLKNWLWHRFFSCEFCKISKNTFFTEHLWATTSVWSSPNLILLLSCPNQIMLSCNLICLKSCCFCGCNFFLFLFYSYSISNTTIKGDRRSHWRCSVKKVLLQTEAATGGVL